MIYEKTRAHKSHATVPLKGYLKLKKGYWLAVLQQCLANIEMLLNFDIFKTTSDNFTLIKVFQDVYIN